MAAGCKTTRGCKTTNSAQIDIRKVVHFSGEELGGILYLRLDRPVAQRSAVLSLIGKERTSVTYSTGEGSATAVEESVFLNLQTLLTLPIDEKGRLKPGNYDIPFRFTIPRGLPATYRGRRVRIQYTIVAKIDVPLGLDIRATREIEVITSSEKLSSGPIYARSELWGDPESSAINFELERSEYQRGETLSGACLFTNPQSRNLRKIDVDLTWIEWAKARNHNAKTQVARQISHTPIESRTVKGESTFTISIPQDAPLTYESSLSSVRCTVTINLDIALGLDVSAYRAITVVGSSGERGEFLPHEEIGKRIVAENIPVKSYAPDYLNRHEYAAVTQEEAISRCPSCGTPNRREDASYCPHCGAKMLAEHRERATSSKNALVKIRKSASPKTRRVEACTVCREGLSRGDDVVWCPYCGRLAHRQHLMDWIRSNGTCPACGESLNEGDYK